MGRPTPSARTPARAASALRACLSSAQGPTPPPLPAAATGASPSNRCAQSSAAMGKFELTFQSFFILTCLSAFLTNVHFLEASFDLLRLLQARAQSALLLANVFKQISGLVQAQLLRQLQAEEEQDRRAEGDPYSRSGGSTPSNAPPTPGAPLSLHSSAPHQLRQASEVSGTQAASVLLTETTLGHGHTGIDQLIMHGRLSR